MCLLASFATAGLVAEVRAQDLAADRLALAALYDATGGERWNDSTNWLSKAPLGDWFGVDTDESGSVTSLDLRGNGLGGAIPTELGNLANLRHLNLEINHLSGAVPAELGNLANLQYLSLAGNRLSGTIPIQLGSLANLQVLNFSGNRLSGTIPSQLGNLAKLRRLTLAPNQLTGSIPSELGNLANLQSLNLGNNQLSGKIPPNLVQLSQLGFLNIRNTQICVPAGPDLQAWLATISRFLTSGLACDGSLRIRFSASSYEVREGESVEVIVHLIDQTEGPAQSATISLSASPGGGASGADYSAVPESVTITAPASTASFVVTAVKDDHYDDAETLTLGFRRPLPTGFTAGDPDTVTVTIDDPGTVITTDRQVLESLYKRTGGLGWSNHANWLSASPPGEWFGVVTDGNGRVTSLDLGGNQLTGAIPPSLGRLPYLERLRLGRRWDPKLGLWTTNELSGAIPPELGELTNLQELDLGSNELSGAIPPELGELTNLQELDLSSNELGGTIPQEFGELINLQELDLSANELSGAIPPQLSALSSLQQLVLWGNHLSGAIPPELGELTSLQRLDLSANELSGAIPPQLSALSGLQQLVLFLNQLSGSVPPELGELTSLRRLALSGNKLSGAIPLELAGLENVQRLELAGNELSGAIPRELGELTSLQRLNLSGNKLSGTIPPELAALTNLKFLLLGANQLSGTLPRELAALANLDRLFLWSNKLSGAIPPELGELTNLRELNLAGNELSGIIPAELVALTDLQLLDLSFNQDLRGEIPPWLERLPLSTLGLMATTLCAPEDSKLQQWLATIEFFHGPGLVCGRSLDPMIPSIDIAVFYTPEARRLAGGIAEIEAKVDLMVAETNQAYVDSGVNQQIVLVAREEVRYEGSDGFLALRRFRDRSDGYMDEIHAIRDRVGADLVHLIAEITNVRGKADFPGAFSISCASCDARVFAHELGHNMGLSHDRYSVSGSAFPFSYGYVNQRALADGAPASARWRTIMAYDAQCWNANLRCLPIMRFSNPNQSHLGNPLGVPGSSRSASVTGPSNAARALNYTRHSVAAFRPARSQDDISRAPSGQEQGVRPQDAAGSRTDGLFSASSTPRRRAAASDPKTLRWREVAIDIGMLAGVPSAKPTVVPLNLFDDVMLTGIVVKRAPTYSGGYALSGPLFGLAGGTVVLVVNGKMVSGTVRMPGAIFRIQPTGKGRHAIVQIDPSHSSWRCGTELWPQ